MTLARLETIRIGLEGRVLSMTKDARFEPAAALEPGKVVPVDGWSLGNYDGEVKAVSRRCRHLGGDLGRGSIDGKGCLVCPWHAAKYDPDSGRMVRGPQGIFAKVPGLGAAFKTLTKVLPLKRGEVSKSGDSYEIRSS